MTIPRLFCAAALLLLAQGCGAKAVEGHYEGTVTGTIFVLLVPVSVQGTVGFDLIATGEDMFRANGDMVVRKPDGTVTYEAIISGDYAAGNLDLTFVAKDAKSSGTMKADWRSDCFRNGSWTITGTATTGSGSWEACR